MLNTDLLVDKIGLLLLSEKLVPNLNDKTKYVTHYINLKLYTRSGMRLTRIHRILEFGWRRSVVVSGVRRMNEVNALRARLLPGWVTVFGRVYHLVM